MAWNKTKMRNQEKMLSSILKNQIRIWRKNEKDICGQNEANSYNPNCCHTVEF